MPGRLHDRHCILYRPGSLHDRPCLGGNKAAQCISTMGSKGAYFSTVKKQEEKNIIFSGLDFRGTGSFVKDYDTVEHLYKKYLSFFIAVNNQYLFKPNTDFKFFKILIDRLQNVKSSTQNFGIVLTNV